MILNPTLKRNLFKFLGIDKILKEINSLKERVKALEASNQE